MKISWPMWVTTVSSFLPLSFEVHCLLFPQRKLFQGHSFEKVRYFWDLLDCSYVWTQLRILYKLLRYQWVGGKITFLVVAQGKHHKQIPLLIKVTDLEWSSECSVSLLSLFAFCGRDPIYKPTYDNALFVKHYWNWFHNVKLLWITIKTKNKCKSK